LIPGCWLIYDSPLLDEVDEEDEEKTIGGTGFDELI
jgi:hypothetical protein